MYAMGIPQENGLGIYKHFKKHAVVVGQHFAVGNGKDMARPKTQLIIRSWLPPRSWVMQYIKLSPENTSD